jgi:hypothetical protein
LYEAGHSLSAIASDLGVSKDAVRRTLTKGGVALRAHSHSQIRKASGSSLMSVRTAPYGTCVVEGRLVEEPRETSVLRLILKLWEQGMSHCGIAKKLNDRKIKPRKADRWSQPTVGYIIKRHEAALKLKGKSHGN